MANLWQRLSWLGMLERISDSFPSRADVSLGCTLASNLSGRYRDRTCSGLFCSLPRLERPDYRLKEANGHLFIRHSLGVSSIYPFFVRKLSITP